MHSLFWRHKSRVISQSLVRTFTSSSSGSTKKSSLSFTRILLLSPPLLIGGWIAASEHPRASAALALNFPLRLSRDIFCVASIVQGPQQTLCPRPRATLQIAEADAISSFWCELWYWAESCPLQITGIRLLDMPTNASSRRACATSDRHRSLCNYVSPMAGSTSSWVKLQPRWWGVKLNSTCEAGFSIQCI